MIDEWDILLRVVVAGLLGGLVGYDRSMLDKPAGVRTHMLVGAGSALFVGVTVLVGLDVEGMGNVAARIDVSRVMAGVVTGIGFLGAGAIITRAQGTVRGLTTAAGIWTVAAIGCATAFGFWILAVGSTLLTLAIHGAQFLDDRRRKARA